MKRGLASKASNHYSELTLKQKTGRGGKTPALGAGCFPLRCLGLAFEQSERNQR